MDADESFEVLSLNVDYSNRTVCEWIRDDQEGFRFCFSGDGERQWLEIRFDYPLAYRKIDEGDFLRTLKRLRGRPRAIAYEVVHSEFLHWYHDETLGVSERRSVRHFVFLSDNDCIEVLSEERPVVVLIDPC